MNINQNLGNLMKEAQKMQQEMQKAQQQLSELVVTGESGGGLVKITMNGRHNALKAEINKSLLEKDVDMLEDLILAAINNAVNKVEVASKEKITKLTAGLNIPTDFLKNQDEE